MNKDVFQGNWTLLKGKIKEKWGNLTDDDLAEINGKREQLLGKLQKRYGLAKEKAEKELMSWETTLEQNTEAQKTASPGSRGSHK